MEDLINAAANAGQITKNGIPIEHRIETKSSQEMGFYLGLGILGAIIIGLIFNKFLNAL